MRRCLVFFAALASCGSSDETTQDASMPDAPWTISCTPALPAAPTGAAFGWQGMYKRFVAADGSPCESCIAVTISDHATCYVATDGSLRCAGAIYNHTYGPQFVDTGQREVDQILLSATFNSPIGNTICVHKRDGTAWCMGGYNAHGQFGNGSTDSTADFVQWGRRNDLVALGTASWDQICAQARNGHVYCAGYQYGTTPVDAGTASFFWFAETSAVRVDDASVFRISNDITMCQIQADGAHCHAPPQAPVVVGTAGAVVDVFAFPDRIGSGTGESCWLDTSGRVQCYQSGDLPSAPPPMTYDRFVGAPVIAIAGDFHTTSYCAVRADGSLWCIGDNVAGHLGTSEAVLATETQVAPPGSVRVGCPSP